MQIWFQRLSILLQERSKRYVTHSLALSHSVFREKNAFKQKNSLESLALKINLKVFAISLFLVAYILANFLC